MPRERTETHMKATICRKYGPPDVLELEEIQKPAAGDDEVLVRVHAASVNSWDWDNLRGKPFLVRLLKELLEAGRVAPVIDGHYTLREVPEALRHLGEGRVRGKAVITI